MSLVRVGLSESKGFAEGYEAIFGKKKPEQAAEAKEEPKADTKPQAEAESRSEKK